MEFIKLESVLGEIDFYKNKTIEILEDIHVSNEVDKMCGGVKCE